MTTAFTPKQPYEAYGIGFDFTDDLLDGEIISSATIVAIDRFDSSDVSLTLLDVTKQSETDTIVYGWVRAGTSGHSYVITCQIVGDAESLYELDGILTVIELPAVSVASSGSAGLAGVIQRAAKTAFKIIGDVPLTCTYTSVGVSVYVPATGLSTSSDTDYESLSILFEDYTAKEITDAGGVILSTDQKGSIPNLNLTPTPKVTDIITDSNSQKWTVENVRLDAARALYVMQVRRSA